MYTLMLCLTSKGIPI